MMFQKELQMTQTWKIIKKLLKKDGKNLFNFAI